MRAAWHLIRPQVFAIASLRVAAHRPAPIEAAFDSWLDTQVRYFRSGPSTLPHLLLQAQADQAVGVESQHGRQRQLPKHLRTTHASTRSVF